MTATKLIDTRKARITTLEEAKSLFDSIASAEIRIAKIRAMAEARIATIKNETAQRIEQVDPDLDEKRTALADFVTAHPELFTKPRHVSTDFGRFGLQDATRVDIVNKQDCIDFVVDQGMLNCYETTHSPNKAGLLAALMAGTAIPGCRLLSGDIAHYTVKKALLDEAKKQ